MKREEVVISRFLKKAVVANVKHKPFSHFNYLFKTLRYVIEGYENDSVDY